jgi:putative ABC transport system permease protein
MKLIAGRNFSPDRHADDRGVIITESTARFLGYDTVSDIIGHSIVIPQFGSSERVIIGIVNDYHQVSLKKTFDPGVFTFSPYGGEIYSVRINPKNISQTVADVGKAFTKAFPGNPFEYFFLDDYFNRQYANEQRFGKLFTSFAILAIIIGCVGLFGLSAYTASRHVKEIGIRKVLGASVSNIVMLLSKDFVKPVLVAIIIASPIAWWAMNKWLEDFAYKIDISWWVFVLAGFFALLIALVTVSFQAIKAAIANPVKSLRTE